jgi:signal peptidase I
VTIALTTGRALRVVALAALWLALGLGAGLLGLAGAPRLVGMQSFTVMSGSMEPTISTGDVVVERRIHPLQAHVGDIVTFKDQTRGGELVTHRVRSIRVRGPLVSFVTRGDANTGSEHWSVRSDGTIGRVAYHLPLIGYALVWTRLPIARILLVVVPALLLAMLELGRIWRPRRPEEVGDAPAG